MNAMREDSSILLHAAWARYPEGRVHQIGRLAAAGSVPVELRTMPLET